MNGLVLRTSQSIPSVKPSWAIVARSTSSHPDPLVAGCGGYAEAWATLSPELLNYGLALLVYAVRYPAVFWRGNKTFGALFSVQLMANGAQCLLAWLGAATLYKVQVYGAASALPTALGAAVLRALRQGQGQGQGQGHGLGLGDPGGGGMLLSPGVTLGLLGLGTLLVLASSLVLYLYGYGRLHAFLQTEAAKRVIRVRPRSHGWVCFTHCAALCVLACSCVVQAPLVHDWLLLYRGSLDTAVLGALCACGLLLLSWLGLWLLLTVKSRWTFKLRVTVAQAVVRSARSVRLCSEVELRRGQHGQQGGQDAEAEAAAPLLVVGNGRAYTVADPEPRSAILAVIGKSQQDRRARMNGGAGPSGTTGPPGAAGAAGAAGGAAPAADPSHPGVYWLRPGGASGPEEGVAWMGRKASKPKVTFDETTTKRHHDGGSPPVLDDGDYALLQELPLVATPAKHSTGGAGARGAPETSGPADAPAAGPVSAAGAAAPGAATAAPQAHLGSAARAHEDPSPLLTPEPLTIASDLDDEAPLPDLDDLPPPPPN
ncbi:Protein tincar, partial [Frankliniella fusca]